MKLILALLCAAVGLYLMYRSGKRRFERRNSIATSESYSRAVTANAFDDIAWKAGIALIVIGSVLSL